MKIDVIAFSANGCGTAIKVRDALAEHDVTLYRRTKADVAELTPVENMREWTERAFRECDAIVFIGAVGIAVRYIAPFVKSKTTDPAIVAMDEHGIWAISLLSGHIGGGNELTQTIADRIGSEAIVTTATDLNGKFAVDSFAVKNGLRISSMRLAQEASVRVLNNGFVGFTSEIGYQGRMPDDLTPADSGDFGIAITRDSAFTPFDTTLRLIPMDIVLGVGCRRDTDPDTMKKFVRGVLAEERIDPFRVSAVASITLKKDEPAILSLAKGLRVPALFFTAEELNSVPGEFSSSSFVSSVTNVDCVCERSAVFAGGVDFVRRKTAENGMTLAICTKPITPRFS